MRFHTLADWLAWQEQLHPRTIDLGLERVARVYRRLNPAGPRHAVITVGGTNGKGSTVAMLDSILRAAGYRVGAYTSPHLLRYTERIHLLGEEVGEAALCEAFGRVDAARGDVSLTYFEFGTLAALDLFDRAGLDVAILEVGMGGRLDAVNIVDADVTVITNVGIDHTEWLGADRESIGWEKAGILRGGRPAVFGESDPPYSLSDHAQQVGARLLCLGRDYRWRQTSEGAWRWQAGAHRLDDLPLPALPGIHQLTNASGVLMALLQLAGRLPVPRSAFDAGLRGVRVAGRFQIVPGPVTRIIDVAHNPAGAQVLAATLRATPCAGATHAVVGMLADKDIPGVMAAMRAVVDDWHLAPLEPPRGAPAEMLRDALRLAGVIESVRVYDSVVQAQAGALAQAQEGDRIVIFGSFHTAAQVLEPQ